MSRDDYPLTDNRMIVPSGSIDSAVNGLQGLAILLIVAGALPGPWAPVGSFFGIDLLLLLTGLSATRALLFTGYPSNPIGIIEFYKRLIQRFLPLVWIFSALVVLAAFINANDSWMWLRRDLLSNVLFVSDLTEIIRNEPVPENYQRAPLLWHLWLFSLIAQLFLILPVLVGLSRRKGKRFSLSVMAVAIAASSMAWLLWQLRVGTTPETTAISRLWMGLDTRASGFFLGVTLACILPFKARDIRSRALWQWALLLSLLGIAGVFFIITWTVGAGDNASLIWAWPLILLLSAALVLLTGLFEGRHSDWLSRPVLQWMGLRSLAIYVWYWPVIELLRLDASATGVIWLWELLQAVVIFSLAELTHRLVINPLLQSFTHGRRWWKLRRLWFAGCAFVGSLGLLYLIPIDTTAWLQSLVVSVTRLPISRHLDPMDWQVATQPLVNHQQMLSDIENSQHLAHPAIVGEASWVLVIGDGLLLAAKDELSRLTPDTQISADLNISTAQVLSEINTLRRLNQLAPQVVLVLGNTRAIGQPALAALLRSMDDRERVLLVNNSAYGRYAYQNQRLFTQAVQQYRHVVLVDWLTVSTKHPEVFDHNRLSLTPEGKQQLATLIRQVGGFSANAQVSEKPYTLSLYELIEQFPLISAQHPTLGFLHPITTRADLKTLDKFGFYANVSASAMQPRPVVELDEGSLLAAPLMRNPKPIAPDVYWDRIADCETGGRWNYTGRFGGGLGIFEGTWNTYGGTEFAKRPGLASRAQQIVVANRISTQGYYDPAGGYVEPVGFTGWGCANLAARPVLIVHTARSILAQSYRWSQQGALVEELEAVLGLPISGSYDLSVHQAHVAALKRLNLPRERAPEPAHGITTARLRKRRATLPNYGPYGDH